MITELLVDARFSCGVERTASPPAGLFGGEPALANQVRYTSSGELVEPRTGKVDGVDLAVGDVVTVRTGGGGGYGDPRERPAARVVDDVTAGYVTASAARSSYGVVVGPDGALDGAATEELRAGRSAPGGGG